MRHHFSTLFVLTALLAIIGCGEDNPAGERLDTSVAAILEPPSSGVNQEADGPNDLVAGDAATSKGMITTATAEAPQGTDFAESDQDGEAPGQSGSDAKVVANAQCVVRLIRVRIPAGSTLRDADDNQPELFVKLLEDGERIRESTTRTGYLVEYPKSEDNTWTIREGHSYSLEVLDYDYISLNDSMFQVVGLTIDDFISGAPILEQTNMLTPREQAASIEFEVVRNE